MPAQGLDKVPGGSRDANPPPPSASQPYPKETQETTQPRVTWAGLSHPVNSNRPEVARARAPAQCSLPGRSCARLTSAFRAAVVLARRFGEEWR